MQYRYIGEHAATFNLTIVTDDGTETVTAEPGQVLELPEFPDGECPAFFEPVVAAKPKKSVEPSTETAE